MNKKIIIFIIIFLIIALLLIAGGIFWWRQGKEIKGSPKDYMIKETKQGKIVENKKARLKVGVPEGWEVKKIEMEEGAIEFHSPEIESDWREGKLVLPIKKGCIIQASAAYEKANFTDIKINLRYSYALMGMKSVRFEDANVNNYPALKSLFDTEEGGVGVGISISVPISNKVYGFSVIWGPNEKEQCIQEFDKFLKTVSIK